MKNSHCLDLNIVTQMSCFDFCQTILIFPLFSTVFSKQASMNESVCLFWGGWRSNKKGGNGVPPPSQSDKKLTICPVPRIALAVPRINCVFG